MLPPLALLGIGQCQLNASCSESLLWLLLQSPWRFHYSVSGDWAKGLSARAWGSWAPKACPFWGGFQVSDSWRSPKWPPQPSSNLAPEFTCLESLWLRGYKKKEQGCLVWWKECQWICLLSTSHIWVIGRKQIPFTLHGALVLSWKLSLISRQLLVSGFSNSDIHYSWLTLCGLKWKWSSQGHREWNH